MLGPCGGQWSAAAGGGSGGTITLSSSGDEASVWSDRLGFPSTTAAADAVDVLIANLASCTAESWRSRPIAQTGAVLAFSDTGVIWIHQKGASVSTLQVPTTDGPPPLAVQVEAAEAIYAWIG
jgi:hypothetical protein